MSRKAKTKNSCTHNGSSRVNPSNNNWFAPTMKLINLKAHRSSLDCTRTLTLVTTCHTHQFQHHAFANSAKHSIYYNCIGPKAHLLLELLMTKPTSLHSPCASLLLNKKTKFHLFLAPFLVPTDTINLRSIII